MARTPLAERMATKTNKRLGKNVCWEWTGFKDSKGYGKVWNPEGSAYAHVVAYVLKYGPPPEGFQIDHTCNNTSCVRPSHLEAVTGTENNRRRDERLGNPAARKDHCKNGHPFSGDNLFVTAKGHRVCRACGRDKARRRAERMRNGEVAS